MNWKYVLNTNNSCAKNHIEASAIAGNAGYQFFLYREKIYFGDDISLKVFETKISENDLF